MNHNEIEVASEQPHLDKMAQRHHEYKVGEWILFTDVKDNQINCLGVVKGVGSNYVSVRFKRKGGDYSNRIHINNVYKQLKPCTEADARLRIEENVDIHRTENQRLLGQLSMLIARMGIGQTNALNEASVDSTALVLHREKDVKEYEQFLVRAKEKDIPELQSAISKSAEKMSKWMEVALFPLSVMQNQLEKQSGGISDKIFNVKLYAGLLEDAALCQDGTPAPMDAKLHIMQRRLYMDEESLLDYNKGGMSFADIGDFDKWLCRPNNLDRILPHSRCMVSMRVRRNHKERGNSRDISNSIMQYELRQRDNITFLYIRNGDKVSRLDCDLDFGEMLFPDKGGLGTNEPMMVDVSWSSHRDNEVMPVREYEALCLKEKERSEIYEQWNKGNPEDDHWKNPHRSRIISPDSWELLNDDNVYLDDTMASIEKNVGKYNRIALIIQGLFDRSEVLHPHPPVQMWTAEGVDKAVKLVYDSTLTLAYGDPAPDFKEYRRQCNKSIGVGSAVIGQENVWLRKMAEVENRKMYPGGFRRDEDYIYYSPPGNDGPGYISTVDKLMPRAKKVAFLWERDRMTYSRYSHNQDKLPAKITVSIDDLFNVDAYKPGDCKMFFRDPRTREKYLEWAPFMIAAEDYHYNRK
jgi:hypothetical protein